MEFTLTLRLKQCDRAKVVGPFEEFLNGRKSKFACCDLHMCVVFVYFIFSRILMSELPQQEHAVLGPISSYYFFRILFKLINK